MVLTAIFNVEFFLLLYALLTREVPPSVGADILKVMIRSDRDSGGWYANLFSNQEAAESRIDQRDRPPSGEA